VAGKVSEDNGAPKKTIVFANTKVGRAQRDAVSLPEDYGKSLGNCAYVTKVAAHQKTEMHCS